MKAYKVTIDMTVEAPSHGDAVMKVREAIAIGDSEPRVISEELGSGMRHSMTLSGITLSIVKTKGGE